MTWQGDLQKVLDLDMQQIFEDTGHPTNGFRSPPAIGGGGGGGGGVLGGFWVGRKLVIWGKRGGGGGGGFGCFVFCLPGGRMAGVRLNSGQMVRGEADSNGRGTPI